MSVVINTNYAATLASNNLATSSASLQKSLNRLSSGSKIVSPADDAGGLAVSMKLSAAAKSLGAQKNNIGNAVSFLQTQDGAMKTAASALERMSELAVMNQDVTKSSSDLANYNTEFTALSTELGQIAGQTFNGKNLFGSSTVGTVNGVVLTGADLTTQIGTLTIANTSGAIDTAIQNVATLRATNGAAQSRLGFESDLVTTNKANLESANSRIVDVDVAEESTQLARWNTLVQAGTSMLSQANSSSQTALKLLQ
jgi:flagellin